MERITTDANYLLHELYSHYLGRVRNGESKSTAKMFGSVDEIQKLIHNHLPFNDVDEALRELSRAGYLYNDYGDDSIRMCYLEDKAIADCEHETSDKVSSTINKAASIADSVANIFSVFKKL